MRLGWLWVALCLGGCDDDEALVALSDGGLEAAAGAPCGGAFSCPRELFCVGNGEDAFFCMAPCEALGGLCGEGSLCVPLAGADHGICYLGGSRGVGDRCDSTVQCARTLRCIGGDDQRHCQPACTPGARDQCSITTRCVAFSDTVGHCQDRVGSECHTDADCGDASLRCDDGSDASTWRPRTCTRDCASDGACTGDAVCLTEDGRGQCVDGCVQDGDCRTVEGFRCIDAAACASHAEAERCRALVGAHRVCLLLP